MRPLITILLAALVCAGCTTRTQSPSAATSPRESIPLTTWEFVEDVAANAATIQPPTTAEWKEIAVPHVFRQSGLPDNTAGWYRQTITLTEADRNKRVYLELEGAASVKDVFVNGQFIGRHKGAFSACAFDLTDSLKAGQTNILDVRVSNRDSDARNCFSRSTLYYVNGGMFRKAWLVKTGAVHIFPDMGSSGVYLTPSNISSAGADLEVLTVVRNPLASPVEAVVRHFVTDPDGKASARFETKQTIAAGETARIKAVGSIDHPKLWDIGRPNLYTVRTEVSVGGQASDVVTERVGLRTIAIAGQTLFPERARDAVSRCQQARAKRIRLERGERRRSARRMAVDGRDGREHCAVAALSAQPPGIRPR